MPNESPHVAYQIGSPDQPICVEFPRGQARIIASEKGGLEIEAPAYLWLELRERLNALPLPPATAGQDVAVGETPSSA
jgi:hypothetical protein